MLKDPCENPVALKTTDLSRSFMLGNEILSILSSVSIEILRGEWVAVTGQSGSGKSTLMGLLAGLDQPSGGQVVIGGKPLFDLDERSMARLRNRSLGVVFQSFHLIPTLTARENIEVPMHIGPDRANARRRADMLLALVDLSDRADHRPHQLSGGQQQRVAIARALANEPEILLADEPTGNLDSRTTAKMLDLFETLKRRLGLTMLMITHDAEVAARADRIITLVDGRIEQGDR